MAVEFRRLQMVSQAPRSVLVATLVLVVEVLVATQVFVAVLMVSVVASGHASHRHLHPQAFRLPGQLSCPHLLV